MLSRTLRAFGLAVTIDADDPQLFPLLDQLLPPFPEKPGGMPVSVAYRVAKGAGPCVTVLRGHRTIALTNDVSEAAERLVSIFQSTLARTAAGWTFIHAGVVAIAGKALLLPARSGAGKSTLVAALLGAGADYGSDEFAVLDRDGHVHPYSRPLALRIPEQPIARVLPGDLGRQVLHGGTPVGAVLFTAFQPGATLVLRPISPGHVVLGLLAHTLGARGRPIETLGTLRTVAHRAPGFVGARGDANGIAGQLIDQARSGWRL